MNCPNCGRENPNQTAIHCPYCYRPLNQPPFSPLKKRTGFPTAGGVLIIVACGISFVVGILGLIENGNEYYYYYPGNVIAGVFNVIGFAFGITAGILTLRRRIFPLAIAGASLALVSSTINTAVFIPFGNFIFGISAFVLSILGVTFTAVSKSEFTRSI